MEHTIVSLALAIDFSNSAVVVAAGFRHERVRLRIARAISFTVGDLHFYFTFVSYFLVCDLESLELTRM